MLERTKKNAKEYLLEFAMISLAVMLGFFAENLRDYISDRDREKDYMIGLINNLQSDTTELQSLITVSEADLLGIDTLMHLTKENFKDIRVQDSIFYYGIKYGSQLRVFQYNDVIISQLRNAGGYGLIRSAVVSESLARYERNNSLIEIQKGFYAEAYIESMTAFGQVFDRTKYNDFFTASKLGHHIPQNIPVVITGDEKNIHLLYNHYWMLEITRKNYLTILRNHQAYLSALILFLRKEYDVR